MCLVEITTIPETSNDDSGTKNEDNAKQQANKKKKKSKVRFAEQPTSTDDNESDTKYPFPLSQASPNGKHFSFRDNSPKTYRWRRPPPPPKENTGIFFRLFLYFWNLCMV